MTISKLFTRIISAALAMLFALGLFIFPAQALASSFAYAKITTEAAESAGYSFILKQYEMRGIKYEKAVLRESVKLYDDQGAIIGLMVIVDRDGKSDYAVVDYLLSNIDEYGFGSDDFVDTCRRAERVLYAGTLNYAKREKGELKSLTGEKLNAKDFSSKMNEFRAGAALLKPKKTGYDGIIGWAQVADRINGLFGTPNSMVYNSQFAYLPGISRGGVASNLHFWCQNPLNDWYNGRYGTGISGTCGPTAMVNMMIYLDKQAGFNNGLVNDSVYDTFASMIYYTNFMNWTDRNWWNFTVSAFKNYASQQGYNYTLKSYYNCRWNNVLSCIKDMRIPMFATFGTYTDSGSYWNHAVVILGLEEFTHVYYTPGRWGRQDRHSDVYRYVRIVDGWWSSDEGRFIDFDNYYTEIGGIGFSFK